MTEPSGSAGQTDGALSEIAVGYLYTTGCFLVWGLSPLFWKLLSNVPAQELLAHRILWCSVLMLPLMAWRRSWSKFRQLFKSGRTMGLLVLSTVLIGINWFLYISAVNSGHIVDASLGYFINPLFNVLLGILFLGERLRRWQGVSVALATLGVVLLTLSLGSLPWIALALPASFGFYGLVRKSVAASPEEGLTLEVWLLLPFVLAYLISREGPFFGAAVGPGQQVLLVATGLITALPLIWFTHGARRLPLSTVGVLQYLAPTGQFLLGVFVFGEEFSPPHLVAFSCIWLGLIVFTVDARKATRQSRVALRA